MNILNRILAPAAGALRPRLACEITDAGIVAARPGEGSGEVYSAFAPLPAGTLAAGLKTPNFRNREAVVAALRQALDQLRLRENHVTAIVPDAAVRVLLLDFDSLPAKAGEALPIIRFRLRKLVPFEVEDAAVSYQVISTGDGLVRAVVAVSPGAVMAEYESVFRDAGYEPGAVLPSTLAALAAVSSPASLSSASKDEPSLVVHCAAAAVTTAITRQNELLLHRTVELSGELYGQDGLPGENAHSAVEELRQSVSVAVAYFEDTLTFPPHQMLACGAGGADELMRLLGDSSIPARDLVPPPSAGYAVSMPHGILAGVVGALAG